MIRLALVALLWCGLAVTAAARESILDYQSRIVVNADASLTVTDNIRVRAEGKEIRRGIYRAFPTLYRNRDGNRVRVPFEVLEVLRDGHPEPYHLDSATNGKVIYFGKEDVFLKPGEYTYTLTYRTDRQLGFFADHDELYWNVTGSDWMLARDRIEAVVVPPPGASVLRHAAYTGLAGQRGNAFAVDRDADGNLRFRTTRIFSMGEDLTVAVAWPKGFVPEPTDTDRVWYLLADNADAVVGMVGLLLVLGVSLALWMRVGRDPTRGTIIPLFEPPKGLSPAATRFTVRMGFDDKAFAAAIVDMAVKGYLEIDAVKRDFTLRVKDRKATGLSRGERRIGEKLFGSRRDSVILKDTEHSTIGAARDALKATLKTEYGAAFFSRNYRHLIPGAVLTLASLVAMVLAAPSPSDAAALTIFSCFAMIGLGAGVVVGTRNIKTAFSAGSRFTQRAKGLFVGMFAIAIAIGLGIGVGGGIFVAMDGSPISLLLLALLLGANVLFVWLMQAPTAAGRQIMDAIEGFKMYLSVAEQDRLDILHPPEMTPKLFEKYLPYALALDVETAWTERFAAILDAAQADDADYRPYWYHGRRWDRSGMPRMVGSLGGAFVGTLSASANPPGSSGGGSGGGGFSGGGGGGGGGGGW